MKVKTKQWGKVQMKSFNLLSVKSFWSYKYFVWSVFPLLLGASTGNFSQRCFHQFSWGSWLWPHPLISEHSLVRDLWPVNTPSDRKVPTVPEMKPLQKERSGFYAHLHVYKKKRNCLASADQCLSTASQDSYHVPLCPPTSPYSTLFC